jgi:hypothetical protein
LAQYRCPRLSGFAFDIQPSYFSCKQSKLENANPIASEIQRKCLKSSKALLQSLLLFRLLPFVDSLISLGSFDATDFFLYKIGSFSRYSRLHLLRISSCILYLKINWFRRWARYHPVWLFNFFSRYIFLLSRRFSRRLNVGYENSIKSP